MLKLDCLPEKTKRLFEQISIYQEENSLLSATLMGGTALALQIGHRLSEDLDFFYFEDVLPKQDIRQLLRRLTSDGFAVHDIMNPSNLSTFRINTGKNLPDYIQEYSIDGVKVSFGTFMKGSKSRRDYLQNAERLDSATPFSILALHPLFQSKAMVIMDRVRSRDLFDLMVLMSDYDYTVEDIVFTLQEYDERTESEIESAIEVLTGNVKVDKDDPGFNSINLSITLEEVYKQLTSYVDDYEQKKSLQFRL